MKLPGRHTGDESDGPGDTEKRGEGEGFVNLRHHLLAVGLSEIINVEVAGDINPILGGVGGAELRLSVAPQPPLLEKGTVFHGEKRIATPPTVGEIGFVCGAYALLEPAGVKGCVGGGEVVAKECREGTEKASTMGVVDIVGKLMGKEELDPALLPGAEPRLRGRGDKEVYLMGKGRVIPVCPSRAPANDNRNSPGVVAHRLGDLLVHLVGNGVRLPGYLFVGRFKDEGESLVLDNAPALEGRGLLGGDGGGWEDVGGDGGGWEDVGGDGGGWEDAQKKKKRENQPRPRGSPTGVHHRSTAGVAKNRIPSPANSSCSSETISWIARASSSSR